MNEAEQRALWGREDADGNPATPWGVEVNLLLNTIGGSWEMARDRVMLRWLSIGDTKAVADWLSLGLPLSPAISRYLAAMMAPSGEDGGVLMGDRWRLEPRKDRPGRPTPGEGLALDECLRRLVAKHQAQGKRKELSIDDVRLEAASFGYHISASKIRKALRAAYHTKPPK